MDLDMELNPNPTQARRPGKGRRAVLLAVLAGAMFGSGYAVGSNGGLRRLALPWGPKAAAAANPEASPPPAQPAAEPSPNIVIPTAPKAPAAPTRPAGAEHALKPVRKPAATPAAPGGPTSPAASASKNAAANARPAASAKQPTARYQPSTAKISVLTTTLQTTRSQLELYNLQHRDQYPTLAQLHKDWTVLTKPTDVEGKVMLAAGRSTFGPYLKQVPVNPITQSAKVAAPGKAAIDTGWTYDEQTGLLKAVLPTHVIAPELDAESVERVGG